MKLKGICLYASYLSGSVLLFTSTPAHAFSFTTNYTADLTGSNQAKGNIWLNSVTTNNGTISNFSLVNQAVILSNDPRTSQANSGAASSERGDLASGINKEAPANADVVSSLGNLNLNNIIDTEDTGSFKMNLFFSNAVDTLLFWERGQNSQLGVQAIDASGSLIGNLLTLNSAKWNYAGFGIDTTEISGTQKVGSLGVNLADLNVSAPIAGIQITSQRSYNGPDFKVVGALTQQPAQSVPEPATLAGLSLFAGMLTLARRKSLKSANA
jgi:hypothetical protein